MKKSKWGTTSDDRSYPKYGEWLIATRRFNVEDGTHFFQVKFAKNPQIFNCYESYMLWRSKSSPRKRKEFASHQEAYDWAIEEINRIDKIV